MRAKKSLGQNFLKSVPAIKSLILSGNIEPTDIVLEVGPGKGVLTEKLLEKAQKVIAIEKDRELIGLLQEKFSQEITSGKLELREQDILEFDPSAYGLEPNKYKIIANIPYYITGSFLQKFLESSFQPSRMVLMLQKEVAKRIVARDLKESILSVSVKAYGEPKYIETVKAKYFSPAPKVDSAIILIENISKQFFDTISEEKFFLIIKLGFAHKRKMLIGNLKEQFASHNLEALFNKIGIDEKARAEDLTLSQWKQLAEMLSNL